MEMKEIVINHLKAYEPCCSCLPYHCTLRQLHALYRIRSDSVGLESMPSIDEANFSLPLD
jgi:hypothetical protein